MNDLVYQQKYQFYSNGPYALVDAHYRNIWMTLNAEQLAHMIRQVFVSKLTLLVCDLRSYTNFDPKINTVDSDVCLDWQVSPTRIDRWVAPELTSREFDQTMTNYSHEPVLINQRPITLLDRNRQLELQDQIFLFLHVYGTLDQEIFNSSYFKPTQDVTKDFVNQIHEIFMIELSVKQIEQQLITLAKQNLSRFPWESSKLIQAVGGNLYE